MATRLLAGFLLAAVAGPVCAGWKLSPDDARLAIENTFGVSLKDAAVVLAPGPLGDDQVATFRMEDAAHWRRYTLDLELGGLTRYETDRPEVEVNDQGRVVTPLAIDEGQARELALAEAQRLMGAAFGSVREWRKWDLSNPATFHLVGEAPPVGDPPHHGLTPRAVIAVSLVTGRIVSYGQFIPIAADPIPPKISKDEAVKIGAERLGQPDAKPDHEPTLYQDSYGRGELTWMVRFVTLIEQKEIGPDGKETVNRYPVGHLYTIDALTGEIVKEE